MASHKYGEIKYNVGFNVDNQSLQDLKKTLQEISNMTTTQYKTINPNASQDTRKAMDELVQIKKEARLVEEALSKAFNSNLGTTNISKFSQALKGVQLDNLYRDLKRIGPAGESAFRQLTTSLVTTNMQIRESHKWLDNMATSLKNTIKWGISSSIFNNLSSSIQKAWSYAKNLDKSLNDIRIVAGQSAEEMNNFAVQATRAAQTLGASTLDYTKGALIYYQQGLNNQEVAERTEVTLKMANVLGTSASEVSDYMTAIWNNFDNGSKSLEYYADVITALGAATASSSEEIADGLEKFAAIADTVGLSYEYATTALATVVAETRQSADVVGTAFKTLFARIQDLELGNTLDDGTTLGKYSEALEKVGINIKDQSGQLKDMDDILDEMGSKWQTLSRDQQTALAQTVAGTRQYTQLVALMDNWDTFGDNLKVASDASGTLQKQQDIYLESTEAHLNQLSTATERLMNTFIDNKGINSLVDGLTNVVQLVANFVESIGGGGNALLMLGSIGTQVFSNQIANGIGVSIRNLERTKQAANEAQTALNSLTAFSQTEFAKNDEVVKEVLMMSERLQKNLSSMGQEEINTATKLIQELQTLLDNKVKAAQEVQKATQDIVELGNLGGLSDKELEALEDPIQRNAMAGQILDKANVLQYGSEILGNPEDVEKYFSDTVTGIDFIIEEFEKAYEEHEAVYQSNDFPGKGKEISRTIENVRQKMLELIADTKQLEKTFGNSFKPEDRKQFKEMSKALEQALGDKKTYIFSRKNKETGKDIRKFNKDVVENLYKPLEQKAQVTLNGIQQKALKAFNITEQAATKDAQKIQEETTQAIEKTKTSFNSLMDAEEKIIDVKKWVNLTSSIGQFATALNSIGNIPNIFNNEDLSTGEKILQITSALATGLAMLGNSVKLASENWSVMIDTVKKVAVNYYIQEAETKKLTAAKIEETIANKAANAEKETQVVTDVAAAAADGTLTAANIPLTASFIGLAGAIWTALAPLLPFIAAGGAVVGVIAGIVTAFNKDKEAAKKAAEYAQQAADVAEKATQRYEDMAAAFEKYDNAVDKLKNLKVGTEEYKQAVEEANEAVMDLIKSDNSLAKHVIRGDNGVLQFDDEGQLLANAKSNMNNAKARANIAQIMANQAQLKSDRTDFLRAANLEDTGQGGLQSALINGLTPTTMALNTVAVGLQNALTDDQLQTVLQTISDNNGILIREDLEKLDFLNDKEIDQLMKNEDALLELTKSTDDLNATNKLLVDESLRNALEEKQDFAKQNDAAKNAIVALYGDEFDEKVRKALEKEAEDIWDRDAAFGQGNEDEVHKAYAKLMGYQVVDDHWGDTADYYDPKTGEEIKKFSDDAARAALKQQYIVDNLANYNDENYNKISQAVQKITNSDFNERYGEGLEEALLNSIAAQNGKISLESIYGVLDPTELLDFKDANGEWWKTRLGLTDEQFKTLGFSGAQDFANAFNDGLVNYKWDAGKALDLALNGRDEELKGYDLETEDVKDYSKYIMDIADSADDFADSLKYDAEAATIVTQSIMRMNNGIDKLAEGFKDWTDVLKKSEKTSEEYYEAFTKMQDAVADLLDTEDEYITDSFIQDHLNEIKKAADGDAEAIDNLHKELAKDIAINIAINNSSIYEGIDIEALKTQINNLEIPDIEVGASMNLSEFDADKQEFFKSMMSIAESAHMTAEEANAFFGQMGFEAKFETHQEKIRNSVPVTTTESEITSIFPLKMTSRTYQSGTEEVEQVIDVPSFSTDGSDPVFTKKATGSYNNYSSKNKGGGGPGKSGGDNKPDNMEGVNAEIDRYHQVNTQITKTDNALKRLQSQTDKFIGSKWVDNLNAQWDKLNAQIDNYNEKLRIAGIEQDELANKLRDKGVQFNADGTIANYTQVIEQQEAYVNSLIDNYNKMSKDAQEKYKDTVEQAKEDFDKFQTDLDRYDEIVSDFIPDLYQSIQDALDEQIELNIQKFNKEIEVTLDMDQATRDWNDWVRRAIQGFDADDIFGSAQARLKDFYTYFNEAGTADAQVGTKQLNALLEEFRKMDAGEDSVYGSEKAGYNRAQAIEDLRQHYEELMQSITDVIELQDELHQDWLDKMDEVQERFDEQIDNYQFLRDLLTHDLNLIQLTLGDDAYAEMAKFYQAQQENYEKQLDFQRQQKDFWYAQMQSVEEGTKEWESARDKWKEAVNEFNSIFEEGLENAKEKFENAINDIFKRLNQSLTKGMGLDFVETQWDLINQNADRYLDTINATYAIRELEKKYVDSINNSDNIAVQQRLRKVMEEQLASIKERDRITQYDVDRANKLYEIELARIALEEAQRNKSQIRLRRDSQGNYSYQYVADNDAISDAENELSNAYNDLYNFDKERYNEVLNDIYDIWNEYQQAMAEAALINDPELRAERERLIQEQYNELMMQAAEDYQVAKHDLEESFFWDWVELNDMTLENFKNLTDNEIDIIMTEMVPTWKNGISEMGDIFSGPGGFAEVTQQSWEEIKQAENEYAEDMQELEIISGQTFDSIISGADDSLAKGQELIQQNEELIAKYGEELDAVRRCYDAVRELRDMFKEQEQAAIRAAEAARQAYDAAVHAEQAQLALQQQIVKTQQTAARQATPSGSSYKTSSSGSSSGSGSSSSGGGSGSSGGSSSRTSSSSNSGGNSSGNYQIIMDNGYSLSNMVNVKAGDSITLPALTRNGYKFIGWDIPSKGICTMGAYTYKPTMSETVTAQWIKVNSTVNASSYNPGNFFSTNPKGTSYKFGFDTGGYTGEWDNSGKLALLHQKELVLNAEDTKNMLNTVAIMRNLAYSLGSNTLARLAGATASGINGGNSSGGGLEQNVHIDAQFPNVRNAAEIEEALNNLVNAASQRIHENR